MESGIALALRCRAAARAMVSVYHSYEEADEATPAPNKKDLHLTFQVRQSPFPAAIGYRSDKSDPAATHPGYGML